MEILKLDPAIKDYLWGGRKLVEKFNKVSNLDKVAETWEMSNHKDGSSIVINGEYKGLSFSEYLEKKGKTVWGKNCEKYDNFPIMIKFIDAKQKLSIQVHPDDAYAKAAGMDNGKTELWYIVECDEDAYIYFGVNRDMTKEEFKRRIEENTVLEVLNKVPVHKGDYFLVEAGTIHAIGAGIIIYEIQQNSNCTFRVYDYDRRDADGNPRKLHIAEAIEVSNLKKKEVSIPVKTGQEKTILGRCDYFTAVRYECQEELKIENCKDSFVTLTIMEGCMKLRVAGEEKTGKKGESFFIPADSGAIEVQGNGVFITVQT